MDSIPLIITIVASIFAIMSSSIGIAFAIVRGDKLSQFRIDTLIKEKEDCERKRDRYEVIIEGLEQQLQIVKEELRIRSIEFIRFQSDARAISPNFSVNMGEIKKGGIEMRGEELNIDGDIIGRDSETSNK